MNSNLALRQHCLKYSSQRFYKPTNDGNHAARALTEFPENVTIPRFKQMNNKYFAGAHARHTVPTTVQGGKQVYAVVE